MSTQAKLKPEANAGGTKSGGREQGARTPQDPAKVAADIEKAMRERGKRFAPGDHSRQATEQLEKDKRAAHKKLGHVPAGEVGLTESEKARRAVYAALGHGPDGKCPAGVDWRGDNRRFVPPDLDAAMVARQNAAETHSANPSEATKKALEDAEADFLAACIASKPASLDRNREALAPAHRRASYYNHTGEVPRADDPFPSCGWWWCGRELKHDQWIQLHDAIKILKTAGIDPCGVGVALAAGYYTEGDALVMELPDLLRIDAMTLRGRQKYLAGNVLLFERTMQFARWAACPSYVQGKAYVPLFRFLHRLEDARMDHREREAALPPHLRGHKTWWPKPTKTKNPCRVAAALLILFGLNAEGSTLKKEIRRMEVHWSRGADAWKDWASEQEKKDAQAG